MLVASHLAPAHICPLSSLSLFLAFLSGIDPLLANLMAHTGHLQFRNSYQREAVEARLRGNDVLFTAHTGSGKSVTYQLPALMEEQGVTQQGERGPCF